MGRPIMENSIQNKVIDVVAISFFVLCLILTGFLDEPLFLLFAFLAPLFGLMIIHYRMIYWLGIVLIPLSTELYLGGGIMVDFPIEFIMIVLTGLIVLIGIYQASQLSAQLFLHPISLLLIGHLLWMVLALTVTGFDVKSIKFLLAKSWYVGAFFFMSLWIFNGIRLDRFFYYLIYPLLFTVLFVLIRHGSLGFGFDTVNLVLDPFYRNHVNYSAILAIVFPFAFYLFEGKYGLRPIVLLLLLAAIYLTYTRAAYIAVVAGMAYFLVVKFRLTKILIVLALLAASYIVVDMVRESKYLAYAPDYENTISHENFDDLLEATYKMQDVSTMERLHRWVAGFHMIADRPIFGFGPGRFYENYQSYTVNSFKTYISDNEEKSGIHSYYLMTAVEQGLVGLLWFLVLIFAVLLYGERIYHRMEPGRNRKILLASLSALVVIHLFQLINDLLEADKVGPLFFINLAIIIHLDIRTRRKDNITQLGM